MNIVIIKGNLTRDPELRFTPSGSAVCDLGVAVNRVWHDQSGEKKEEVSYFDVQAWAKTAETVAQYFKKGKPIIVQGRLKQESWTDKASGEKRSKVRVVMERFEFCGDAKGGSAGEAPQRDGASEAPQPDPSEANVPF